MLRARIAEGGLPGAVGVASPEESLGRLAVIAMRGDAAGEALEAASGLLDDAAEGVADWIIAIDADADPLRLEEVLFRLASHADPRRDWWRHGRRQRLLSDATAKALGQRRGLPVRDYPAILRSDPEVAARIEARFGGELAPRRDWPRRDEGPGA